MYRIKLIRKNGTCKTELARKSIPPTSLSSQVMESKSKKSENDHNVALIHIICGREPTVSTFSNEQYGKVMLTGTATRSRMSIPAATAMAAWR